VAVPEDTATDDFGYEADACTLDEDRFAGVDGGFVEHRGTG
jgi:hypothetical protein